MDFFRKIAYVIGAALAVLLSSFICAKLNIDEGWVYLISASFLILEISFCYYIEEKTVKDFFEKCKILIIAPVVFLIIGAIFSALNISVNWGGLITMLILGLVFAIISLMGKKHSLEDDIAAYKNELCEKNAQITELMNKNMELKNNPKNTDSHSKILNMAAAIIESQDYELNEAGICYFAEDYLGLSEDEVKSLTKNYNEKHKGAR